MSEQERPPLMLDQINLVVGDMARSAEFYRTLGLDLGEEAPWTGHHRAAVVGGGLDMDLDSTAFASMWDKGWPAGRTGVVIGFKVADREAVDCIYETMTAAGYEGQQAPFDAFWGARYAIVCDPDGNAVGIMSPSEPDRRTEPPALPD
ncbi:MAG TPA: VOC family protein [Acidimicrobiales bacterium]|jgi:catechol 2,3-dioxygenase-like lactoylglutathione lyase family enzyme